MPDTPEQYLAELGEPRREEVTRLHDLIPRDGARARAARPRRACSPTAATATATRPGAWEGEWFRIGLASRKQYISVYVVAECEGGGYLAERYRERAAESEHR